MVVCGLGLMWGLWLDWADGYGLILLCASLGWIMRGDVGLRYLLMRMLAGIVS
jgi:hypothetical protein